MTPPPNTSAQTGDGVAGVEVKIGGTALDPLLAQHIVEVRVQDNLLLPDAFLIRIHDPTIEHVDADAFQIGKQVDVSFASPLSGGLKPVTSGQIAALEPEFAGDGAYICLRGYDRSHALHRTKRTQTYQNSTADDVARKIAQRAGLHAGTVDPAGSPDEFMQQTNETDWEFLSRLAARIDFEVIVAGDTLHFRKAGSTPASTPVDLRWGDTLTSFRPRVTGVQQIDEVIVRGWDPKQKRPIESSAKPDGLSSTIGIPRDKVSAALGGGTTTIADRPISTQAEADALAKSVAAHLGNAFVEAEGVCHGDPRVRAGTQVQISGVGNRFAGMYTISSTTHIFRGARGYETHFVIAGRASRGLVNLATPASKRSWGDGVVVGVVTQNQDPDGLGRVRVKYPALGDDTEGWWARIASPSAGEGRGLMMMPVAGDEVLLAFEHGDVRRPIVLGSLFNGKSKPRDLSQTDGSFALSSKQAVAVSAAGGVVVKSGKELQITSGSDMKVTSQAGLTEQVHADYQLSANGGVTVKAGSSVTLQAQSSVTIQAPSISIQASGQVKISGTQVMLG
jgi:phage protein D